MENIRLSFFYCVVVLISSILGKPYGSVCSTYFSNEHRISVCYSGKVLTSVNGIRGHQYSDLRLSDTSIVKINPNAFDNVAVFRLFINFANSTLDLQPESFEGLPLLTSLEFESGVVRLGNNIFKALPNLHHLSLTIDGSSLPLTRDLAELRHLKILKIYRSNLKIIDSHTFSEIHPSIVHLDLPYNGIERLYPNAFASLMNLEDLQLSNNDIAHLPVRCFSNLGVLKTLNMNSNNLTFIPRDVFNNLTSLETLSMEFNKISFIQRNAFFGSGITRLLLKANNLKEIPLGSFNEMNYLIELNLEKNNLKNIPEDVFSRLPKLKEISLKENKIHNIETNAFSGLRLEFLSISANNISKISTGAFKGLTIKILEVSREVIPLIDKVLIEHTSITPTDP